MNTFLQGFDDVVLHLLDALQVFCIGAALLTSASILGRRWLRRRDT